MYKVKIRERRKAAGFTQAQMGDWVGCGRKVFGEIERGQRMADFEILDRTACILDCSVYELYGDTYSGNRYYSERANEMRGRILAQLGMKAFE